MCLYIPPQHLLVATFLIALFDRCFFVDLFPCFLNGTNLSVSHKFHLLNRFSILLLSCSSASYSTLYSLEICSHLFIFAFVVPPLLFICIPCFYDGSPALELYPFNWDILTIFSKSLRTLSNLIFSTNNVIIYMCCIPKTS